MIRWLLLVFLLPVGAAAIESGPSPGKGQMTLEFVNGATRPSLVAVLPPRARLVNLPYGSLPTSPTDIEKAQTLVSNLVESEIAENLREKGYAVKVVSGAELRTDATLREFLYRANQRYDGELNKLVVEPDEVEMHRYSVGEDARALAGYLGVGSLIFTRVHGVGLRATTEMARLDISVVQSETANVEAHFYRIVTSLSNMKKAMAKLARNTVMDYPPFSARVAAAQESKKPSDQAITSREAATVGQKGPAESAGASAQGEAVVVFMRPSIAGDPQICAVFDITSGENEVIGLLESEQKLAYRVRPGKHLFMVQGPDTVGYLPADLEAGKTYYTQVRVIQPVTHIFMQVLKKNFGVTSWKPYWQPAHRFRSSDPLTAVRNLDPPESYAVPFSLVPIRKGELGTKKFHRRNDATELVENHEQAVVWAFISAAGIERNRAHYESKWNKKTPEEKAGYTLRREDGITMTH